MLLNDELLSSMILSNNPIIPKQCFDCNIVLFFILTIYLGLYLFAAICFCKPKNSRKFKCYQLSILIIADILLYVSSITYFVGIGRLDHDKSKFGTHYDGNSISYFSKNDCIQTMINYLKQTSNILMAQISEYDNNFIEISKFLKEFIKDYEQSFSNKNSKYRQSFNKICQNPNINKNLKKNIQNIDSSRNDFLSQISSFSSYYHRFTESIKTEITNVNGNILKPLENNNSGYSLEYYIYNYEYNKIGMAYASASLIFVVMITYFFAFFFNHCVTRFLYSIFALLPILINALCFVCNLQIGNAPYFTILKLCDINGNDSDKNVRGIKYDIANLLTESKTLFHNHSQINEKINYFFNNINSIDILKEYQIIYSHYSRNPQYRTVLNDMLLAINEKEEEMNKIKEIIQKFQYFKNPIYSSFKDMQYGVLSLIEKVNESYKYFNTKDQTEVQIYCTRIHLGYNCCVIAYIFFFVGIIIMSIIVCLRRRDMLDYNGVSNKGSSDNGVSNESSSDKGNNNSTHIFLGIRGV